MQWSFGEWPRRSVAYQNIIKVPFYTSSRRITAVQNMFKAFLDNKTKNTLVLFGPSGSGKHFILEKCLKQLGRQHRVQSFQGNHYNHGNIKEFTLEEQIKLACRNMRKVDIAIFEDLPEKRNSLEFYHNAGELLNQCQGKIVFLLNSTIYNQYTVQKNIEKDRALQLSTIEYQSLKPYSEAELKALGKEFLNQYGIGESTHINTEQLAKLSNGDARRLLNSIWFEYQIERNKKTISKVGKKDNSNKQQQKRVTIFHFLGKLLYNKRVDIPSILQGIKDPPPKRLTANELLALDPPFYFDPVSLFKLSQLNPMTVQMLIHENYYGHYADVGDVCNMASLFCQLDTFGDFMFSFLTVFVLTTQRDEFEQMRIQLLSWGIMLYNLHCSEVKTKFHSFRAGSIFQVSFELKQKKKILRYLTMPTRTSDMLECALFCPQAGFLMGIDDLFIVRRKLYNERMIKDDELTMNDEEQTTLHNIRLPSTYRRQINLGRPNLQPEIKVNSEDISESDQDQAIELLLRHLEQN